MATKKTTKPKVSSFTKQIATRMDVVAFARLLASSLGNDRWLSEDIIKNTFNQSGPSGTVKKDEPKATKIPNLESDNKVIDSLLSIQDLLKKNYNEKIKFYEKRNQFKVEQSIERKKQNDDFIKSLQGLGGGTTINNTATKVTGGNGLFGDLGELLSMSGLLFSIGRFFLGPVGLALLAATSLASLLAGDKNPEATTKGILSAGDVGMANQQMMEVVENTEGVEKRKQKILANRPMSKKSFNVFNPTKEIELQTQYLKEIGFDEKTGLTQAEKNEGYTGVDNDGVPIKEKPKSSVTPTTEVSTTPPTVSPQSSLSAGESIVEESPSMPTPLASPNVSQKFDVVNNENLEMKLPQTPTDKGMMITNNEKTQRQKGSSRVPLPSVRNAEETFQRMILNSTRVV